mgnify:CR=1 FL=1
MAMNRVQFQPGLSMHEFMDLYGTQEKCEAAVIAWRWPKGYVCPSCGQAADNFSCFRRGQLLYRQCCSCHFQCSVIAGTIFEATKLPLTVWFLAMHLLRKVCATCLYSTHVRTLGVEGAARHTFSGLSRSLRACRWPLRCSQAAIAAFRQAEGGFLHPALTSARRAIHRLLSANKVMTCAVFFASPR